MSTRLPVGKGSRTRTARLLWAIAADLRCVASGLDLAAENLQKGANAAETAALIDDIVCRGHFLLRIWTSKNRPLKMVNKGAIVCPSEVD